MRKRAEERRAAKLQEEQVRLFQPQHTSWLATSVPLARLPHLPLYVIVPGRSACPGCRRSSTRTKSQAMLEHCLFPLQERLRKLPPDQREKELAKRQKVQASPSGTPPCCMVLSSSVEVELFLVLLMRRCCCCCCCCYCCCHPCSRSRCPGFSCG